MGHDEAFPYSQFYNNLYEQKNYKLEIERIIKDIEYTNVNIKNQRRISLYLKHLEKLKLHSTMGTSINDKDLILFKKIEKRIFLLKKCCVRRIQSKVLDHLWKPDGFIHKQNLKELKSCTPFIL